MLIRHLPRTVRTLILVSGMTMLTVASAMERFEHRNNPSVKASPPEQCDGVKDPRLDLAYGPG